MTPKEKAFELYKMYNNIIIDEVIEMKITYLLMTNKMAKKAALIAVDEILEELKEVGKRFPITSSPFNYYEQVKIEIENYEKNK